MMPPGDDELPPGVAEFIRQQQLQQAYQAMNQAKWHAEDMALEAEARRAVIRFAAIMCACEPWPHRDKPHPAQVGCLVHGSVSIYEGEIF